MCVCKENPAYSATPFLGSSSRPGTVCSVNTFCPARGPTATRYVIEWPMRSSIALPVAGSKARKLLSASWTKTPAAHLSMLAPLVRRLRAVGSYTSSAVAIIQRFRPAALAR